MFPQGGRTTTHLWGTVAGAMGADGVGGAPDVGAGIAGPRVVDDHDTCDAREPRRGLPHLGEDDHTARLQTPRAGHGDSGNSMVHKAPPKHQPQHQH